VNVDLRFFSLEVDVERLSCLLSGEEQERASRFKFDRDRNRFIACRGTLRELLRMKPHENFSYGKFGKPMLEGSQIHFNVSHSNGMGMIAIVRGREVGCDIERIDPSFANDKIPEQFFSPREVAALRALPAEDQCDAFFRCWTRKEAYIKACGKGMYLPLDSFDVTLAPDRPAAFLRGVEGWSLHEVQAPPGFAAAMVMANHPFTRFTNSRMSSITKSGGAEANVSG
jgi:4'-phosphopantetheinyl transferase